MIGCQTAPAQLFYDFCLDDHVPADHLLRGIDRHLDLDGVRAQLKPFYSTTGRPSIDPELMMRMLIIGYSMRIRSERRLCEEVHLNLPIAGSAASAWMARYPITPASRRTAMAGSGRATYCDLCLRRWWSAALRKGWSVRKGLPSMPA